MKKSFWLPFLTLAGSLMFSITALAGNINDAEQNIISTISETYEYDGDYYKVTDAYIGRVTEYLSRDDIDMTQSEASSYIRQFQSNLSAGISGGYMEKVDNTEGSDSSSGETDKTPGNNSGNSAGDSSGSRNDGNSGDNTGSDASGEGTDNVQTGNTGQMGSSGDGNIVLPDNSGDGTAASPADTGDAASNASSFADFFSQSETGTQSGVTQDNTIGSTTDGEVEYTVFPLDRETMYVWDTDSLDVHSEAYKDSEVIGTLNKGDAVTVTGAATTGWAQIDYDGETGYVSAVYLRTQGYMAAMEENGEIDLSGEGAEVKDYSDAAPLRKSFNLGTIAIVIVLVCLIGSVGIILWHRNRNRKR